MTTGWNTQGITTLLQNKTSTVGVVRMKPGTEPKRIIGFFNKKLLQEAMDALDVLECRDFEICYLEDPSVNATLLLLRSPLQRQEDVYFAVAGKSEAAE